MDTELAQQIKDAADRVTDAMTPGNGRIAIRHLRDCQELLWVNVDAIVLALNSHDALVNALQQARTMLKAYGSDYDPCHVVLMEVVDAALVNAGATLSARITSGEPPPDAEAVVPNLAKQDDGSKG